MTHRRHVLGLLVALSAGTVLTFAATSGSAARATTVVAPALGNWEGRGPFGLRLSFAFVRRGSHVGVADLALGLPVSCRVHGAQTWDAGMISPVEFLAPGTVLHGPFPPLGPRQFEFFLPPTRAQPLQAPFLGSFSSAHAGVLDVPSWTRYGCHHSAWPATLRFTISPRHRVHVADGLWRGTVTAPSGMSGTVAVRVIDGGRIETDIEVTYVCPPAQGGSGNWSIGPLRTTGFLIAADGSIGGTPATETQWRGRFDGRGVLSGTFTPPPCLAGTGLTPRFRARRASAAQDAVSEKTGGRRTAVVDQLAPASPDPNTSPEVAPK